LNAADASKSRGRLIVETKPQKNNVEINITDFGRGIETKNFSKIFEPFFTTKSDGVGLGLYISKLIVVDNHQGKIDVKSKRGKGTTFSVLLPKKTGGVYYDR
jgi:signal transduction histidine kinase